MNRRTKFILGLAVAGITFASLMAFTGRGNHFRNSCEHHCNYMRHHHCHEGEDANQEKPASNQEYKTTEADSTNAPQ